MKRNQFLCLLLFCAGMLAKPGISFAQTDSQLPAFGMFLSNGHYFKSADLPKNKPVLLIYFAPDCEHCHTLMNEFFKRPQDFKNAEVIMVTYKPVSELAAFEQAYQVFRYPNIKVGTEGTTFFLRQYFKLQQTPFTALYDRQGKLVRSFRKETPLGEVASQLKKL